MIATSGWRTGVTTCEMGPIGFVSCLCGGAEEASNTDSTPGAPNR